MFVSLQIKVRVTAAPGDSLLVKAVSCAVSVVKADRVQGRAATNCESSIPVAFCKLNCCWSLFQRKLSIILPIRTRNCMKLFMENIMEYFAHAQTVCTRSLLKGKGPGYEAILNPCFPFQSLSCSFRFFSKTVRKNS